MKRIYNYKPDKKDERDFKFSAAPTYDKLQASRPSVIDWTRTMSPVKDQGSLGSCVGFALTAMKEFQEVYERQLAGKEYGPTTPELSNLSEQYVYWGAKEFDPDKSEGTSIRYAMQVLQKKGVPTEKFWPYSDKTTGQPLAGSEEAAAWAKIGSYWRVTTLEEILTALSKQPVPIGIEVFSEFEYVTSNGLVSLPNSNSRSLGGHAICLVGYDDNKKLLKFKNSWGTGWGDNGYGYLPYEYFNHVIDAWTCLDLTITDGTVPVTPTPVEPDNKKDENKSSSKLKFILIGVGAAVVIAIVAFLILNN
jgi:C1A family cysteine protease